MKAMVIIPTYNEVENISKLVKTILKKKDFQVLIVDDNSPDGTGDTADELSQEYQDRVFVIHRQKKMGLGAAYIEGFKFALKAKVDYIFTMDADFSHNPEYLPDFLKKINDKECDVVIGSRYLKGVSVVNWPIRRLILSRTANWYTQLITGLKIKDCTSGFKCFRKEVLENINLNKIKSNGYSFIVEMNYQCQSRGFKLCEVPIIFVDRQSGQSKFSRKILLEAIFTVWKLAIDNLWQKLNPSK